MKIIKLTESDLEVIVKKVLSEQVVPGLGSYNPTPRVPKPSEKKPIKTFSCVPSNLSVFVSYVINNSQMLMKNMNIDYKTLILLTKVSIGIIGRETKFGEVQTKGDVASEMLRGAGAGSLVDWGMKVYRELGGTTKSQSLGFGQFRPEAWKEYGLDKLVGDYNQSFDVISQGLAVLYSLSSRYKTALNNKLSTSPSVNPILSQYGVIGNINGTGNHALDMAILSHNMPKDKTIFPYCKTNHPLYAAPCSKTVYSPFEKKESFNPNTPLLQKVKDPKLKQFPGQLTVNRTEVIPNFFPNLKGAKHSAIGYVEEVANYMKSYNCF
jgi:hypothetical protein